MPGRKMDLYGHDVSPIDVRIIDAHLAELAPDYTIVFQCYPNPFNPETWIPYQLAEDVDVAIKIYDAS